MADPSPTRQRTRVIYHGQVQGVGFRLTALGVSRDYEVVGHVRNRPDGTVEMQVQGDPREIETFLAALAGQMSDNIRRTERQPLPLDRDERVFGIRQ